MLQHTCSCGGNFFSAKDVSKTLAPPWKQIVFSSAKNKAAVMQHSLRPVHTRCDPNGSVPKLQRIGLAFTRDLTDPNPFGYGIRTQTGSLSKVIPFGSDPKRSRVNGWDRIQIGTDRK